MIFSRVAFGQIFFWFLIILVILHVHVVIPQPETGGNLPNRTNIAFDVTKPSDVFRCSLSGIPYSQTMNCFIVFDSQGTDLCSRLPTCSDGMMDSSRHPLLQFPEVRDSTSTPSLTSPQVSTPSPFNAPPRRQRRHLRECR